MIKSLVKIVVLNLTVLFSLNPYNAQLERQNWLFGQFAWLNFSTPSPTITNGSLMDAHFEGCTSMSDECGNLLFYSDGTTIWSHQNGIHSVMQDGTNLLGNASATQSAVLIKNPERDNIYYIVTVDSKYGSDGVNISTIDRNLNGGLGAVIVSPTNPYETAKNTLLLSSKSEKISYFHDCASNVSWLIVHDYFAQEYVLFKIDGNGLSAPISYPSSVNYNANTGEIGQIKFSLDGSKIACAFFDATTTGGLIEIMDFNPTTGVPSNSAIITTIGNKVYGVEFSPNKNFLYYTILLPTGELHQVELSSLNDVTIYSESTVNLEMASLQIAPNDKIYVAFANSTGNAFSHSDVGVINDPNQIGLACNFNPTQINLPSGTMIKRGLPNFSNSYCRRDNSVEYEIGCVNSTSFFSLVDTSIVVDSIIWNFGDPISGTLNLANGLNSSHVFSSIGTFNVSAIIYRSCYSDTIETNVTLSSLFSGFTASDTIGNPPLYVDFSDQSTGNGLIYEWDFGDGNTSSVASPSNTFNTTGTYETELIVTDIQGCTDTTKLTISVVESDDGSIVIPTIFTPNLDGKNDVFSISGSIKNMHMLIFNRWGQIMADLNGANVKWDGRTMEGIEVPEGTYYYLIDLIDQNDNEFDFSGPILLKR